MTKRTKSVYRIFFTNQNKGYEIYARKVEQAEMYGFVAIEDVVFGEKSSIVVDPGEESLKKEFSNVKRILVPYHAVVRIDEVEKEGPGKVFAISPGETPSAGGGPASMPPPVKSGG